MRPTQSRCRVISRPDRVTRRRAFVTGSVTFTPLIWSATEADFKEENMEIDAIISRGIELRAQIDELKSQLDDINAQLAPLAQFPPDKATGYVTGERFRAKVMRRTYEKWDQDKLNLARQELGDSVFLPLFRFNWAPKSKPLLKGFLLSAPKEQAALINGALTTSTTSSVSYEEIKR